MTTEKIIGLTRWLFIGKVMSPLFNMLSRLVIAFLPRSKHLLISWLQSPSVDLPFSSDGKESACKAGDPGSIPGSGRSPGEGNDNPAQYSCLENPMDGGAWWDIVHGVAKSQTRLSDFTHFAFLINSKF